MDDSEFLGIEEQKGIPLNDKYKIETLDVLNVVVKEKYYPKPKEYGEVVEAQWRIISYCPNLELAFEDIVDREINITASQGLKEVIKRVVELKKFKNNITT